jgi:hypothetical protein
LFNNIKNIFNFESTNVYYFRKFNKNYKESEGKNFFINKFGNKNKNKIFYVIKRSPGAGIFSNLFYVLQHLFLIRNKRFIPIVDMNNFITLYNEKKLCNKIYMKKVITKKSTRNMEFFPHFVVFQSFLLRTFLM